MTLRSLLIAFITAVAAVLSLAVSAMPAGAALFTPTFSTTVFDASVDGPWSGIEVTGASAYDTSTVTGDGIVTPSGTVTYSFFSNGTCAGTATSTQTVTLAGGTVPNSASQGPLAAGSYSFDATYNGDLIFYGPASGGCDSIVVGPTGSTTLTTVYDASTNGPWSGTEVTGASAYDTSTVTAINGIQPTGSSTYSFFSNGTCAGTATSTQTVTLAGGVVPNSSSQGPLAAGSYSFDATYNGDSNYNAGTSSCEPFTVGQTGSTTSTTVFDAATNAAVVGYRGDRCQRLRHLDRDSDQWDPTHRILHLFVLLERDVRGHGDLHSDGDPGGRCRAQLFVPGSVGGRVVLLRRHLQR